MDLASSTDAIAVECIEDIDLHEASDVTAIQCKYYAKSEYNHSVIKNAIKHMLSHYKEVKDGIKTKVKYIIRGHYSSGQEKLDANFDINFLKKHFLTYRTDKVTYYHHLELGLSDQDLMDFRSLLKVDINAMEYEEQYKSVIDKLLTHFSTTSFSAEFFYYNNALRVIKELAIRNLTADRTITKDSFLAQIDTSSILFNEWFVQKKGKKHHLASLRKEYFTTLNISPFERFFLIEINYASFVRDELKDLIFEISRK